MSCAQDINPQLVARLSQRLFFVVNKVDLMATSEGLEAAEIRDYVAHLVTSQLASCEGFRLAPEQARARFAFLLCACFVALLRIALAFPGVALARRASRAGAFGAVLAVRPVERGQDCCCCTTCIRAGALARRLRAQPSCSTLRELQVSAPLHDIKTDECSTGGLSRRTGLLLRTEG